MMKPLYWFMWIVTAIVWTPTEWLAKGLIIFIDGYGAFIKERERR